MLFSATLSYDVMELAYVFMNDAEKVSVTPEQVTAENIEHLVYHVGSHEKLPLLVGLLRAHARRAHAGLHEHEAHGRAARAQPGRERLLAPPPSPATSTSAGGCASSSDFKDGHAAHPGRHRRRVARAAHRRRDARHQLRPAVRRRGLRAPRRPHRARRRVGPRASRSPARSTSMASRPSRGTSASSCRTTSPTTACWRTT